MGTIAIATVLVCWAFRQQRLSIIIPYAFAATRLTDWLEWGSLTFLLVVFSLFDMVNRAVSVKA